MANPSTLKSEVEQTLMFFLETDLSLYGKVTRGTLDAFNVQKVPFPKDSEHLLTEIKED